MLWGREAALGSEGSEGTEGSKGGGGGCAANKKGGAAGAAGCVERLRRKRFLRLTGPSGRRVLRFDGPIGPRVVVSPMGRCLCFAKAYPHRSAELLPKEGAYVTCLLSRRHSHSERKRRIFVHADSVSSSDKYQSGELAAIAATPYPAAPDFPLFRGQNRPLYAFHRRTADSR